MQRVLLWLFCGVILWGWDHRGTRDWPGLSCLRSCKKKNEASCRAAICPLFLGYVGVGELPNIYLVLQQACHPLQCVPALGLRSFGSLIRTQKLV